MRTTHNAIPLHRPSEIEAMVQAIHTQICGGVL